MFNWFPLVCFGFDCWRVYLVSGLVGLVSVLACLLAADWAAKPLQM